MNKRFYTFPLKHVVSGDTTAFVGNWPAVDLLPCHYIFTILRVFELTAGRRAHANKQRHASFWFVLCIAFVALSIDEASSIHESLMVPIQNALHSDGLLRYAWVVPAFVMVPLFALTSLPFLFSLPKRTALWFLGSGVVYVSGALGFEMLEGLTDGSGVVFVLFYLIEETLEIVGILSFFFSLMAHLATLQPTTLQKPF